MAISFGSINTGLPKDIVNQLIEAERIPINKMEERKGKIVEKRKILENLIALVNKIKEEVQKTQGAKNLRELKVETNNNYISVDLDKNVAKPGNNQIEV